MPDHGEDQFTAEELEEQEGELLPDREEMSAVAFPDPLGGPAPILPGE